MTEPKTLRDLTKPFMLEFMKTRSAEEIAWFKQLNLDNITTKKNNLTGEMIEVVDMKVVRKAFATKYFKELVGNKKNPNKKATWLELIDKL